MTPKDKAQELVDKYDETLTYLESKATAKKCALIAVDEMIEAFWKTHKNEEEFRYWQVVKQEIQAL